LSEPNLPQITALEALRAARCLHEELAAGQKPRAEKASMARRISGLLFAAEANSSLPDSARLLFLRLRTDAHFRAAADDSKTVGDAAQLWEHYTDLEMSSEKPGL
jgi:hypothetical protein